MVRLVIVLLVLFNVFFFWGRHLPDVLPGFIGPVAKGIDDYVGYFTILEILGVVALFADLVVTFDRRKAGTTRNLYVFLIALVVVALFFKLFINYLDSALLEEAQVPHPRGIESPPDLAVAGGTGPDNHRTVSSQTG